MSKDKKKPSARMAVPLSYNQPTLEFTGNHEVIIEGSRGVLAYSETEIRVNTASMTLSFFGRGLNLKCISDSALIIEGLISSVEFHT